ncbi:MAG: MFS transporter [Tepidisphaeraceae bacterium]
MKPAEGAADAIPLKRAPQPQPLPLEPGGNDRLVDALSGAALRRAMAFVTLSWVFGSVWATAIAGAPLTLFANALHASKFEFGLLSALPFIASLASMPASWWTERTGARKRMFLSGLYTQRLLWFPIALLPTWIALRGGGNARAMGWAMGVFLVLVFLMHVAGNVGGPGWLSWMADVVPERLRGKYFSRRRQWGILTAIPAALFAGWFLDSLTASASAGATRDGLVLKWCAILFMCAAIFGLVDIAMFHFVPEIRKAPQPSVPLLAVLKQPLKDREFLWFGGFIATLTFAVSFMGQFVTLYCIERVGVTNTGTQLMLLVAPMLAQLIVLPVWGHAADRMGKKPVLIIGALGLVPVGLGWCLMTSGTIWLGYLLSALGAAFWTAVEVANLNLVLEFTGSDDNGERGGNGKGRSGGGSGYVAMNSVIINVAGCLGGLTSGVIAQSLAHWQYDTGIALIPQLTFYEILFAISAVLRLLAVVIFLPHIHEHGAAGTREALRFMSANIYNNLFNAILQPIRFLRIRSFRQED